MFKIFFILFLIITNSNAFSEQLTRKNYLVCYWNLLYSRTKSDNENIIFNPKEEEFKSDLLNKCGKSPFERDKSKIYFKLENNRLIRY